MAQFKRISTEEILTRLFEAAKSLEYAGSKTRSPALRARYGASHQGLRHAWAEIRMRQAQNKQVQPDQKESA